MDKLLFAEVCETIVHQAYPRDSIGILQEKTLHAVLKHYYEPHTENHEIKLGSFVADIVGEHGIIEIQTQGFDKLRKKLAFFLEHAPVTVVYPIAKTKWMSWIDEETGECTPRRKSPKQGSIYDAAWEIYKIRPLLTHPNLTICLTFLELEEYRLLNGWSKDKKRGSVRNDRIPIALLDEIRLHSFSDYLAFLPPSLPSPFVFKEFARTAHTSERRARFALTLLCDAGLVQQCGKVGRAFLYERNLSIDA